MAAKLELLSPHYHLPLCHTGSESDREAIGRRFDSNYGPIFFVFFGTCSALQHLKDSLL